MKSHFVVFVVIILIACLAGFSTDIYIPSVPAIAEDLRVSIDDVQWTLAVFMMGLSLSQLVYGPISDGLGRKSPLLVGLIIMGCGSAICFLATNIEGLLFGRFLQGMGVGAGAALWRSIFRDTFEGADLAKYGGYLSLAIPLVVPSAPILGGYLQTYFGWRSNFLVILGYTVITLLVVSFFFKETSVHHHKERLNRKFVAKASRELLSSRIFMGYTICVFLTYGAFFSWITASSALLIDVVGITPIEFGWISFITGGGTGIIAGFFNGRLVKKVGSSFMLRLGWALMLLSGILMLLLKVLVGMTTAVIVIPVVLFFFGSTLIWPNAFAGAFGPFGKIAGYAGSLYSFLQLGGGAVISGLVAYLPDHDQVPLSLIFIVCSGIAWLVFEFIVNAKQSELSN